MTTRSPAELNPATWLDEHGDILFRYAMARVRDPEQAEELVQDTLLAALEARERFEHRASVRTWLIAILRRKIVDGIRRSSREPDAPADEQLEAAVERQFTRLGKWRTTPSRWSDDLDSGPARDEFRAAVAGCLGGLPPRLADAFVLHEQGEISGNGIAETMQISTNHVWVLLHRARVALCACLDENWARADRRER